MEPLKPKARPEDLIVAQLKSYMLNRGWLFKKIHGDMYQSGFPDAFTYHKKYGLRLIEVKTPQGRLEASQIEFFHQLASVGCGCWILTSADESQYNLLFGPPNWFWLLPGMKK